MLLKYRTNKYLQSWLVSGGRKTVDSCPVLRIFTHSLPPHSIKSTYIAEWGETVKPAHHMDLKGCCFRQCLQDIVVMTISRKRKLSNVEDDMLSMPKPSGLKDSLRSTCPTSTKTGVQVDQRPEQWVGVGAHILTGSNLYRKNVLYFSQLWSHIGDSWLRIIFYFTKVWLCNGKGGCNRSDFLMLGDT